MGCRFILLRETRKTRRLYTEILTELRNPRRLHEADMQQILRRIDDMNQRMTLAIAALGTAVSALTAATDAETGKLASIEEQLRNADGLSNDETNALADQIASITGTITDSTSKLTNSLSDVHDAAGGSTGGDTGQVAGSGSGSSSGGDGSQSQGSGASAGIDQGDGSGGASTSQGGSDQPQGSDAPQDPPQD